MEELDLRELLLIFWKRKVLILAITLVCIIIGALYSYCYIKPVYSAKTRLALIQNYLESEEEDTKGIVAKSNLTVNTNLLATSTEIIKSDIVLKEVVDSLGIEGLTISNIKGNITVQNIKDTDIIEITVKSKDSNIPAPVANKIAEVFSKKVSQMYYEFGNTYILDEAKVSNAPVNIHHKKDIVIAAFIGLVISVGVILVATMLKNPEDKR